MIGNGRRARRAAEILAATPSDRDRFIDLLRVGSLLVVVAGHWLMATVAVTGETVTGGNALSDLPGLRPLTWALQVMPLFFVAGGFANLAVWQGVLRRGGGYAGYAYGRLVRLLRPTLVYAVVMQVVIVGALFAGVGKREADLAGRLLGQPLWFLAVYLGASAAAPALASWHARSPVAAAGTLFAAAVAVDAARLAGASAAGHLNMAFVWLFAQQLGFWYADGRLVRLPRRVLWFMLGGSVAVLAALTVPGPYPVSMVGLPGEDSNMSPPTVCLLVVTVGQVAAVLLARARVSAWLGRPGPWSAVAAVGSAAMTVYLWHMAVLVTGFGVLVGLGVPLPEPGTGWWWATRPGWLVVLGVTLLAAVRVLGRVEIRGPARRGPTSGRGRSMAAVLAVVAATLGLLGYVRGGLAPVASWTVTGAVVPADPVSSTVLAVAGLLVAAAAAGGWRGLE